MGERHTCHTTAELEEIVGLKTFLGQPESNVLEARRILRVWLEFGQLTRLELFVEALVIGPEQADIRNFEEHLSTRWLAAREWHAPKAG